MTSGAAGDSPRIFRFAAPPDASRLDLLVARECDLSRNQAATLIAGAHVTVSGRQQRASYVPKSGEEIAVVVAPPPGRSVAPEQIPIAVVYEDDDLLVVDKPAGMVVHPAPGNWTGTLVNALKGRRVRGRDVAPDDAETPGGPGGAASVDREGILHRLDKETSGLLIVAKSDRAHRVLGASLKARRIIRRYAVLCWGHLPEDRLSVERPIGRDGRDRRRMAIVSSGRPARTDFTRLARFESVDLLRARLYTGRTHQIRVHLAAIGHPVVGDDTYGGGGGRRLVHLGPRRHFLHASWLVFDHPVTGSHMDIRSPLPADLTASLAAAALPFVRPSGEDALEYFGFFQD